MKLWQILCIAGGLLLVLKPDLGKLGGLVPSVVAGVEVEKPSTDLQTALATAASDGAPTVEKELARLTPQERAERAAFFAAGADTIERAGDDIKTTGGYRTLADSAAKFRFKGTGTPHDDLSAAISKFLEGQIGLDNSALTPEKRAKLVAAYRAMAWAASK